MCFFETKSILWIYSGEKASWHFLTIDGAISCEIKKEIKVNVLAKRGWGSVPVKVTIGRSKWKTSLFPDKSGRYLLPIKKEVRQKEGLRIGDEVEITLELT